MEEVPFGLQVKEAIHLSDMFDKLTGIYDIAIIGILSKKGELGTA